MKRICLFVITVGLLPGVLHADEEGQSTWHVVSSHILSGNCASCHSAGTSFAKQSGLELTPDVAYSELVGTLPKNSAALGDGLLRVSSAGGLPGLQQSFLWEKINAPEQEHFIEDHPQYGAIMPLGGNPLTNGELAFVKEWVLAGAPESGIVADPSLLEDTSRYTPPDFVPLDPPEQGIQLHVGPFEIWPSEVNDREFLYFVPTETSEDLLVNRYQISYRQGSHHAIAYNYPEGRRTPTPNVYRDVRDEDGNINFRNTLDVGNLFNTAFFVGSQVPFTDAKLPEGVAVRLPAGSGFDLNIHSVNRTEEPHNGEIFINLHTVDESEVKRIADYANFGNTDLNLPPNQETTVLSTFSFSDKTNIIQMWSHAHEHMTEFRVIGVGGEHDGELLYWTNDWEHPPLLELDGAPLTFEEGDRVRLETTYNNWTDQTINFGPLSSDEMQFLFFVSYPGEPLLPSAPGDLNDDGTVGLADLVLLQAGYGDSYDHHDFRELVAHYGAPRPARSAAVPEPASILLLLIGGLALVCCRRRIS